MALLTKMSQSAVVPKQVCLSNHLNSLRLSHCRILEGNEFHRCVAKHRLPKVLCDHRTAYIAMSVKRSWRMLMSAMSWAMRTWFRLSKYVSHHLIEQRFLFLDAKFSRFMNFKNLTNTIMSNNLETVRMYGCRWFCLLTENVRGSFHK